LTDLVSFLFDCLTTTLSPSSSAIGPTVYLEQAPEDAVFPYVTFRLSNSFELEDREDYTCVVDIWDANSTAPTEIESLVRQIDGNGDRFDPSGLNGLKYYTSTGIAARIYREAKAMVPDPDEAIRRRRLRYRVIVYDTTSS